MHGHEGDERKRRWHMRPIPATGTAAAAAITSPEPARLVSSSVFDSRLSSSGSFVKDGRKIQVGDCALFRAGNAPPFIGLIRWIKTYEEDYIKLCVNWLYRPADIKLAKGIQLDAAPNEVFYSFHRDVISAGSLFHPCKVAFLHKGTELRAGTSSFVCRRVYDIENKCLWWLTDQDYINERQDEVDQLIDRTRLEMHAAVQSGGRSPKELNVQSSMQQLKSGSESVQNSVSSFTSQTKGKKRDRVDLGTEPGKCDRDRLARSEDGDSVCFKFDNMKAEIAKITEKGGLPNVEAVEKLVNLMQIDRTERKIDLSGRVMLADIIAATDKYDCLGRFVQLKGVGVLDDWLQEVHKGKSGDGSSPKESDKAVEELLLALLRALDKLPVNLNALKTCNIGKSVNNLRSHKNSEIQKKARGLVDTWKKRVNAEMKTNDAKSVGSSQAVAWPGKVGLSEVSQAGNKRTGSSEVTMKSPTTQSHASKTLSVKPGHADASGKSIPGASGSLKIQSSLLAPVAIGSKDSLCKTGDGYGNSDLPLMTVKEEKSSSSSQSQNSQSCSSDHAKTIGSSWKEDARSSTARSVNASKTSGGSSGHRKSSNGLLGTSISGTHKETSLSKSDSLNRTVAVDKPSQSGLTCEKPVDMPSADHGNSHRLIVRLTNPGRSPAQSASGGSCEDPSIKGSRASSPALVDKHEHNDRRMKLRSDASRSHVPADANAESWQSNDVKGLVVSDEGDGSPSTILDDEHSRSADEAGKATYPLRTACSSSANDKGLPLTEPMARNSFSSINALIESCVKFAETSATLPVGDDIGMNLLASVATGEISKPELISPSGSPRTSPAVKEDCVGDSEGKSKLSCEDGLAHSHAPSDENAEANFEKHERNDEYVSIRDEGQKTSTNTSYEDKIDLCLQDNRLAQSTEQPPLSSSGAPRKTDSCMRSAGNLEERANGCSLFSGPGDMECEIHHQEVVNPSANEDKCTYAFHEKNGEGSMATSNVVCNSLVDVPHNVASSKIQKVMVEESLSYPADKEVQSATTMKDQQQHHVGSDHAEAVDRCIDNPVASPSTDKTWSPESPDNALESKLKKSENLGLNKLESNANEGKEQAGPSPSIIAERVGSAVVSRGVVDRVDESGETKDCSTESANCEPTQDILVQESDQSGKPTCFKLSGDTAIGREGLAASAGMPPVIVKSEIDGATKLDFDLNEGIPGDDVHQSEPVAAALVACSSAIHLSSMPPFVSPLSTGMAAPITVAAPAKGPFVPPEKLLKSKGELGWKGSAATSAFRPAEPRKALEMPLGTSDVSACDAARKQGRLPLDIDLNVADERILEDMTFHVSAQTTDSDLGNIRNRDAPVTTGGLDLDLNKVDEETESGQSLARRLEVPLLPVRPPSGGFPNAEANSLRNFDLNNGPGLDEVCAEPAPRSQVVKSTSGVPFFPPVAGLRMTNAEIANMSSWFPPSNSYQAVAIPSFLPDRGEQPYPIVAAPGGQRFMGSVTGGGSFGSDYYRGPVLSSSPAMAFSPAAAFPYAGFPFGSSFPLASTSFSGGSTTYVSSSAGASGFSANPSQLVGPASAVSSHYPRPYVISLPEGSSSGGSENSRKWARQGLDLNAGPGSGDIDGKDERLPPTSRQVLVATSQAFAEEQARLYQLPGAGMKRKEPEGGWDAERYKQLSWQ
ncbi:uncharacterized protein [Typha latifolia]|uniref:uncharacterized protein n=1 Tax=Typha latifolia TaxID=4733 RepID=UPI003C2E8583